MKDKISVLIPVFNREDYVEEAVLSIINQSYKNLDIIIYDDGSTDKTLSIIKKLATKDKRIKIIIGKKNHGGVYAKVQLIKASKTNIICYQDSDDISHPSRIELQSKLMDKYDVTFCKWRWFGGIKGRGRCSASIMFKKDTDILPNPSYILGGGDSDFIERYLKKHPNWIEIPKILYYVRKHNDRIGAWKIKIRKKIPNTKIKEMSYSELIKYYKEYYE